jgi:hypothetical protein
MYTDQELQIMAEKLIEDKQASILVHYMARKDVNFIMVMIQGLVDYQNYRIAIESDKVTDLSYSYSWALNYIPEEKILNKGVDSLNFLKGLKVLVEFFGGAQVEKTYREWIEKIQKVNDG